MQSPLTMPPTPKFAPICGQYASSMNTSLLTADRKTTKFSPKQLMSFAVPGKISLDAATENQPFGNGGGILFLPIFRNLLVRFIVDLLSIEPSFK